MEEIDARRRAEGNAGVDAGRTERDARPLERRKARNGPRAGRRRCLLRSAWPAHAAEPAPARALARVAAGGFARRKNSARCRSPKKAGSREVGTGFRGPAFLGGTYGNQLAICFGLLRHVGDLSTKRIPKQRKSPERVWRDKKRDFGSVVISRTRRHTRTQTRRSAHRRPQTRRTRLAPSPE